MKIQFFQEKELEKANSLDEVLIHLKEQNESLENGRRAILNILEDEKELENELKKEKEGVERKVIERTKELSDEKARLTAAISSLPHVFLIVNELHQLVLSNNRLTPILGAPEGDWTFQKVNDSLGTGFDLETYVDEVIIGKEIIKKTEVRVGSKYLEVYGAPIISNLGAVITIADRTEERMVARSKDEFFSIASHELRTPLTAIRGNTSMLLDYYGEKLEPKIKDMVVDTHTASVRLISIVNDFLNVSRLEQGKMEYMREKVLLNEVVNKICADLNITINKKQNHIINSLDGGVYVLADGGKVEQILINLIGNSMKFTSQGAITLTSHIEEDKVKIYVTDTGSGIPLANQSLLFRKFQQAGSSTVTRDSSQGTGLGLYISRLMAEGMGGTLFLEKSEEGKGSTFCLTLPLALNDNK